MTARPLFARLTGAAPQDLPDGEARNGLIHIAALSLSKTADSLLDPKLVLSWLLSALGAPGAMVGALVPLREAGALLPQLALARLVEGTRRRKLVWAVASLLQGVAALGIAASAILLEGAAAGAAILALLAMLALARAGASVSQKDALARTVPKGRRGAITGFAGSVAAVLGFSFGGLMALGVFPLAVPTLAGAVALAGGALIVAGAVFSLLRETPREPQDPEGTPLDALVQPLAEDGQLRLFIAARAALAVTALAPPFIVLLAQGTERSALDQLGPLVMAATAGSVLAAYIWGRLSDRSSRRTLMAAGILACLSFVVIGAAGTMADGFGSGTAGQIAAAAAMFTVQIAYEGVRAGRKLHLTDMAEDALRARYTALSNTLVGLALLLGGAAGWAADAVGAGPVLLGFAVLAAAGVALAARLDEVQQDAD
ncbi:MFS transporter [Meridianimarinicoccus roseus]|uniref:MFS transporter n=1 Tax=Meridianimarinicoccus roseus TaxID=2072018 RepID=A0A2V2LJH0_9RHOB|nr:MFS transporter [Meridianimarinicoccus roseus]PWR03634.1 MFS transporter [Meridianimarinicoccus roseus]